MISKLMLAASFSAVFFSSLRAQAQNAYPIAACAEYLTAPGATNFIAHFDYLDTDSSTGFIPGDSAQNFFFPSSPPNYPVNFVPGYHRNTVTVLAPLTDSENWVLQTSESSVVPAPGAAADAATNGDPYQPSPTCPAVLIPATLNYSSAGTYTHQFLGQVDSGPPATDSVTVSALSGSSTIGVSNLTYVANDSANPTHALNPNSLYGDVTVTSGGAVSAGLMLGLTVNNVTIATGLAPISFSGTVADTTGCPTVVTSSVQGNIAPAKQLFGTQIWTQLVTLKNASGKAIAGPITLSLNNLSSNAKVFMASGTGTCPSDNNAPYVYVTSGIPANGNAAVVLTFTNSEVPSTTITFTPVVLSGGSKL